MIFSIIQRISLVLVLSIAVLSTFIFDKSAVAQEIFNDGVIKFNSQVPTLVIEPNFYIRNNKVNSASFLESRIDLSYLENGFNLNSSINFNQSESFEVINPRLAVLLPGNVVISSETLRAHPSRYQISQPVSINGEFSNELIGLKWGVDVVREESVIETPNLIVQNGSNLINWSQDRAVKNSFVGSASLVYSWNLFKFGIGVANVSLLSSGDIDSLFSEQSLILPSAQIQYNSDLYSLKVNSRAHNYSFSVYHYLKLLKKFDASNNVKIDLSVNGNLERYKYTQLNTGISFPLHQNIRGKFSFQEMWAKSNGFNERVLRDWRKSIVWNHSDPLGSYLPNRSISFGLQIPLNINSEANIRLISSELITNRIFPSKKEYYTQNPIGYLNISNNETFPLSINISARSTDGLFFYSSEEYTLSPNFINKVPIYLYMPFEPAKELTGNIQYQVTAKISNSIKNLESFNLKLYGPNAWTGDVSDLAYFIQRDEPAVRARSKAIYLKSNAKPISNTSNSIVDSFNELKHFIDSLGTNMSYLGDSIYSIETDQVQFPLETIRSQSGDCEDLVVYLSAHLMSMGYGVSIIDLRPQLKRLDVQNKVYEKNLGHLFMMVDTNIPVEYVGLLDLHEFSYVSRKNKFDTFTIWLPIETTVMSEGFTKAWNIGTLQYYKHIIDFNGVSDKNVQFFDL